MFYMVFKKWRNNYFTWVYFCVYLVFHWGDIVKKVLSKAGVFEKDKKGGKALKGVAGVVHSVKTSFMIWFVTLHIHFFFVFEKIDRSRDITISQYYVIRLLRDFNYNNCTSTQQAHACSKPTWKTPNGQVDCVQN